MAVGAFRALALTLLLFSLPFPASAEDTALKKDTPKEQPGQPEWSTGRKLLVLRSAVAGAILGNALINWFRRGQPDFHFTDDGWFFERDAPNAGADKTGHAFSTYVLARIYSASYRGFGLDDASADWQGPLSGWATMFLLELHDVFQGFGFSYKDIVANSSGALLAYLEERFETLNDMLDYRIEYLPSEGLLKSGDTDFLTDYPGMKHLLVFKLSGIKSLSRGPLSYLELHAGYHTEGSAYSSYTGDEKSRSLYAGVSLNLSRLFRKAADKPSKLKKPLEWTSVFLEYYQPPYVSLDAVKNLD